MMRPGGERTGRGPHVRGGLPPFLLISQPFVELICGDRSAMYTGNSDMFGGFAARVGGATAGHGLPEAAPDPHNHRARALLVSHNFPPG
eukprot:208831-Rhodomonas_salina.9